MKKPCNPQSAIRNPQSAIRNPQSAIRNPQSAIRNPQSAIRNPQSAIECVKYVAATLAIMGMMPTPARAVDGTITINGEITDQTCKINNADPPHNLIVNLPKIGTKALKNTHDTAGATPFIIQLTDCPQTLNNQKVKAFFESGSTTDYGTGNLIAYTEANAQTNAASSIPDRTGATVFNNVQIQLANPTGTTIKVGQPEASQAAQDTTITNNKATLQYLARYIKTGSSAISAGKLVSYVQYSIVYP
ncbi:fimbrial protein [Bordetella holmesii]|nr:fimbrial protein [Bordetella holmesii]QGD47142.1 fimbrial protein [Bordetella holmesii]QGE12096.1 fimbrial protein [Bordetella holmesii]